MPTTAKGKQRPVAARTESRISFGISWFKTEAEADEYSEWIRSIGSTYNGGFYHGRPCGRDPSWDYVDKELGELFAVTE
jgi:hypothetical protein